MVNKPLEFWIGKIVGYAHQKSKLETGFGWRYKVRIFGDNSDVDQVDDKDLSYADVFYQQLLELVLLTN